MANQGLDAYGIARDMPREKHGCRGCAALIQSLSRNRQTPPESRRWFQERAEAQPEVGSYAECFFRASLGFFCVEARLAGWIYGADHSAFGVEGDAGSSRFRCTTPSSKVVQHVALR